MVGTESGALIPEIQIEYFRGTSQSPQIMAKPHTLSLASFISHHFQHLNPGFSGECDQNFYSMQIAGSITVVAYIQYDVFCWDITIWESSEAHYQAQYQGTLQHESTPVQFYLFFYLSYFC